MHTFFYFTCKNCYKKQTIEFLFKHWKFFYLYFFLHHHTFFQYLLFILSLFVFFLFHQHFLYVFVVVIALCVVLVSFFGGLGEYVFVYVWALLKPKLDFFSLFHQHEEKIFYVTSSTRRRGIWNKLNNNFNLTCVWRSGKHSFMLRNTSLFNWEHIEPLIHESFDVPSLLCSHSDVSLSRVVIFSSSSFLQLFFLPMKLN